MFGSAYSRPLSFQSIGYGFSKDETSLQSGTTISSVTRSKTGHLTRGQRTQRRDTWPVWVSPCFALSLGVCCQRGVGGLDLLLGQLLALTCCGPAILRPHPGDRKSPLISGFCSIYCFLDSPGEATGRKPQPTPERDPSAFGRHWRLTGPISISNTLSFLPNTRTPLPILLCSQVRSCARVLA